MGIARFMVATAALALCAAAPASAATLTFTATNNAEWNNPQNWGPTATIPTSADDVVIPAGQSLVFESLPQASAKGVTLAPGASLFVGSARTLTLAAGGSSSFAGTVEVWGGGLLDLNGTTAWSGGNWTVGDCGSSQATVINRGMLEIKADTTMFRCNFGYLQNLGTITRTTSAGRATINANFENVATVAVASGTLALKSSWPGRPSGGSFVAGAGAALAFTDFFVLGSTVSITGAGTVRVEDRFLPLTIPAAATYTPGTTHFSGGDLELLGAGSSTRLTSDGQGGGRRGAGTLSVGNGSSVLDNVTFRGTGVTNFAADAAVAITGPLSVREGATLNLDGTTVWSAGDWFTGGCGVANGLITNAGTLDVRANATAGTCDAGLLRNLADGTITRTTSTGAAAINVPLDNDGEIAAETGTLALVRGAAGETSAGGFAAAAPGVLAFGGPHGLGPPAHIDGTGTIRFDGGTFVVPAAVGYSPGTTLISGGHLSLQGAGSTTRIAGDGDGGSRRGPGTLAVGNGSSNLDTIVFQDAGLTTFGSGGTTAVTGSVYVQGGATVALDGTTVWSAGEWLIGFCGSSTGLVTNGGAFEITGNTTVFDFCDDGAGRLRNLPTGTITRSGSAGTATLRLPFDNDGEVNVQTGTLDANRGSGAATSSGAFSVAGPGTLALAGAHALGAGVSGPGTLRLDGGTLALAPGAAYSPGTTHVSGGFLGLADPGASGRLTSDGEGGGVSGPLSVGNGSSSLNAVTFGGGTTSFGPTATIAASGPVAVQGGATLALDGTTVWSGGTWSTGGCAVPAGTITNDGALEIRADTTAGSCSAGLLRNLAGGAITRTTSAGVALLAAPLENAGQIDVQTGTLATTGTTQTGGATRVAVGATFGATGATTTLAGGLLRGTGTVRGELVNQGGRIAPGASPGRLVVDGPFTQGPAGTLEAEVTGTGFDVLEVSGAATLDGALAVVPAAGFDPGLADTFGFLTSASRSGAFAAVTGAALPSGKTLVAEYPAAAPFGARLAVEAPPLAVNTAAPTVTGTVAVGETLTCQSGAWTGDPAFTTFVYQWLDNGQPIAGATGRTLLLTAAHAGHEVSCTVTADNSRTSVPAASAGRTVPAPASPTPTPGPVPPTFVDVRARILKALAPTGSAARLRALVRNRGFVTSFEAPSAGVLSITWTARVRGKRVAIGSGRVSVTRAGVVRPRIRLTARGRRLLRGARRFTVTAAGSFAGAGAPAVTASRSVRLRR